MVINTKINIGEPALIRYGNEMRLGLCTSITCFKETIKYQFDIGNTYVTIDTACFEKMVYFNIYDAVNFMKEAGLFVTGI